MVTRHLPLTGNHPNAFDAAIAAEAAGRQDQFDEMSTLLYENMDEWDGFNVDPQPFFEDYAQQLGLDLNQFRADQNDSDLTDRVQRDVDSASDLGLAATPSFRLNGRDPVSGSLPDFDDFVGLIQTEIDALTNPFALDRISGQLLVRDPGLLTTGEDEVFEIDIRTATETQTVNVEVNVL